MKNIPLIICLLIMSFSSFGQIHKFTNDTIFLQDGSKIIDDFFDISIEKKYTFLDKIKEESAGKNILKKNKDYIQTKISNDKITKIIEHDIRLRKIKDIRENDIIANIPTKKKNKKYVHYRTIYENIIFSNGKRGIPPSFE